MPYTQAREHNDQPHNAKLVWHTPIQPEHVPVGSVVRWKTAFGNAIHEATVTGHARNGIRSWVIKTDGDCPFGRQGASFNSDWVVEVVSRGTGKVVWENSLWGKERIIQDYMQEMRSPQAPKGSHQYGGRRFASIIRYVLTTHPAFSNYYESDHHPADMSAIIERVKHVAVVVSTGQSTPPYCLANKKKLVRALKKALPQLHTSKTLAERAERENDEE